MLKEVFEKLKGIMNSEKSVKLIVFGGVVGLTCILLSSWISDNEEQTEELSAQASDETYMTEESQRYAEKLEKRLEEMLSQIEGVGSCSIMVTVAGSVSYSYAQNAEQQLSENSREIKNQHVILDEKTGDSALIECANNPEVVGVIIACEGGEHNVVREEIVNAVGAVLNIPSNRICITKKISESGD